MDTPKTKKTTIKQRAISFGEKMNNKRLVELQKIKDKRQTIRARKLAKQASNIAPENNPHSE